MMMGRVTESCMNVYMSGSTQASDLCHMPHLTKETHTEVEGRISSPPEHSSSSPAPSGTVTNLSNNGQQDHHQIHGDGGLMDNLIGGIQT